MATAMDVVTVTKRKPAYNRQGAFVLAKGPGLSGVQKRQVQRLLTKNTELKHLLGQQTLGSVSNTPTVSGALFDVPQGDTDGTRDGDSLAWCGWIDLKLLATNGIGATGDIFNVMRVILFQWHPASNPLVSDILGLGPSGIRDVFSNYKHDTRSEFVILFDKCFTTVGNTNAAGTPGASNLTTGVKHFKVSLKKAQKKVLYTAGTLTGTNRIYACYMSDSTIITHPTLTMSTKIVYRDS